MLDPVADMLTRIRNAGLARHGATRMPHSKMKERIALILKNEGYISNFEVGGEGITKYLSINLKYDEGHRLAIRNIKRVSKSGCRVYSGAKEIQPINQGLGIAIVSTSKGVLTDKEARQMNVGGEVLCEIW